MEEKKEDKKLSDEDMGRVNRYLETPVASVERKPFRPFRLLFFLIAVVSTFSAISVMLARLAGIE